MRLVVLVLCALVVALVDVARASDETFVEEVLVERLNDGVAALVFSFTSDAPANSTHLSKTSKPIASLMRVSRAETLDLWFGRGRWNARRYGAPTVTAKPSGAEVVGTWDAADADAGWRDATTMLGGIFCASLGGLRASTATTTPAVMFRPWDGSSTATKRVDREMVTKYAHLPREAVCVENLAPWLKQLPCRERGGFARALRSAHDVFGAEHLTFGVRARVVGDRLSIEQTLMMALPSASTAFANARDALSRAEDARCVATDRSLLHVRDGDSLKTYEVGVDEFPESMDGEPSFRAPTLFVERFFTGTGNEAGGVVLDLERANWGGGEFMGRAPVRVRLFQTFPWFVKMYLHTLAVEIDGRAVSRDALDGVRFVPAVDRARSSELEVQMMLPANTSTIRLQFEYDKGFIRAQEFPPDGNRGFDLPPARVDAFVVGVDSAATPTITNARRSPFLDRLRAAAAAPTAMYTQGLLLLLPTPDFSMTFNVAGMTGTAVSVLFMTTISRLVAREAWRGYAR